MYRGLKANNPARVIYLDMNAFFASIEQELDPSCRGKPIAVVSHIHPKGTVLASSYEAKALGISTGTKVSEATRIYPNIIFRETQLRVYRDHHNKFINILREKYGSEIIVRSVDEVAIILPPNWQSSEKAREMALEIKKIFRAELGSCIRCSIGIAPNIFLAKLATDLEKPDGLVEINEQNIESILKNLKLTDLPGIAHNSAVKLAKYNITNPLEIYQQKADVLFEWFGIWGQLWWWRLHGYEADDNNLVVNPLKSASHQHVLKKWSSDITEIQKYIELMANRLIFRLQNNNLKCQKIGVYLSLVEADGLNAEHKFESPCDNGLELMKWFLALFKEAIDQANLKENPVRKITIYFNDLSSEEGNQMDLFTDNKKREIFSQTIQTIREKFGFDSIGPGCAIDNRKLQLKEQLGFGKIKDKS